MTGYKPTCRSYTILKILGIDHFLILQQCCVRVQVVKSESESSPLSPSPGHHLKDRVRVITSESESESKKKIWVRVKNLVVHIFNICLSSKTWKQTTKCIECQSKQRNMARPLLLELGRDSRVMISESESASKWKNETLGWVRVKWTRVRVPTRVTQHCITDPWFILQIISTYMKQLARISEFENCHQFVNKCACHSRHKSIPRAMPVNGRSVAHMSNIENFNSRGV